MMLVGDASVVLADLGAIRAGATDFVGNVFAPPMQLQHWAASGLLERRDAPGCVLLFRREDDFCRLYFGASTPIALREAMPLAATRPEPLVCDVIGRPAVAARVGEALAYGGFVPRVLLARMARQNVDGSAAPGAGETGGVTYAKPAEAPEVRAFLERLLDRYAEQIPEAEEIAAVAERNGVLAYRVDGAIAGMLLFDRNGLSAHLRYWWIDPVHRNRGIGSRLMRVFLRSCADARRIVLWVVSDNADSVSKYEHYGFRRDGLVDQIMYRPGSSTP